VIPLVSTHKGYHITSCNKCPHNTSTNYMINIIAAFIGNNVASSRMYIHPAIIMFQRFVEKCSSCPGRLDFCNYRGYYTVLYIPFLNS